MAIKFFAPSSGEFSFDRCIWNSSQIRMLLCRTLWNQASQVVERKDRKYKEANELGEIERKARIRKIGPCILLVTIRSGIFG